MDFLGSCLSDVLCSLKSMNFLVFQVALISLSYNLSPKHHSPLGCSALHRLLQVQISTVKLIQ